jgi:hypothetical protein
MKNYNLIKIVGGPGFGPLLFQKKKIVGGPIVVLLLKIGGVGGPSLKVDKKKHYFFIRIGSPNLYNQK